MVWIAHSDYAKQSHGQTNTGITACNWSAILEAMEMKALGRNQMVNKMPIALCLALGTVRFNLSGICEWGKEREQSEYLSDVKGCSLKERSKGARISKL